MTDKLHCPYCGEELSNDFGVIFCYNEACKIHGCELNEQVIRDIIDGKKAQRQLRTAKDRCAKKIKAKEREIAKYLNGINVRDKEIQNLREQLQKTQEALEVATDCIENIGDTWRGDIRWTNDDMDEIRINTEKYCDSVLKKIKGAKK